jgi:hypothetical protein
MVVAVVLALMLVDVMTWAEVDAARRERANSDSFIVQNFGSRVERWGLKGWE